MNINQAKQVTKQLFTSGQAVLWSSKSGMGKSQVAYQLAEDLKAEGATRGEKWGIGVIFAATQTPPDLIGYQFKGERDVVVGMEDGKPVTKRISVTDPSCPLWYISTEGKPAFCYDKFFLIIDEYGQGEGDVKRAIAEIFLNGGTSPWYLPPGSVRIGLTNEGARYGVSKDFDFCIARRSQINITPDIDGLLTYADKPYQHQGKSWTVMPVTKAWGAANPAVVFEDEPQQQGPWCSPRQLFAADRYLQVAFAANNNQEVTPEMMEVLAGTIGMPATTSYASHMQFLLELPSYADVVAKPSDKSLVPGRADLQMLMAYQLAGHAQPQDLSALITYMQMFPKDMGVTFISALLRRDYKGMISQPAMQAWINKNAALVSIIASLSN
jgi:hypothetical protein